MCILYIFRDYYIKREPALSQGLQLSMSLSTRHPGESWIRCQPAARVGLDPAAIRLFDDSLLGRTSLFRSCVNVFRRDYFTSFRVQYVHYPAKLCRLVKKERRDIANHETKLTLRGAPVSIRLLCFLLSSNFVCCASHQIWSALSITGNKTIL